MTWDAKRCGVVRCGTAAVVVIDPLVARLAAERFGALTTGFGSGLCTTHWRTLYPLALPGPDAPGDGMLSERDAPGPRALPAPPDAPRQKRGKKPGGGDKERA